MLVDKGGFWYTVLAARYGEVAGRLGARVVLIGGGRWLGLRTALVRMGKGWFTKSVSRKAGDGADTFFWYDRWLGYVPLCQRFSR